MYYRATASKRFLKNDCKNRSKMGILYNRIDGDENEISKNYIFSLML